MINVKSPSYVYNICTTFIQFGFIFPTISLKIHNDKKTRGGNYRTSREVKSAIKRECRFLFIKENKNY